MVSRKNCFSSMLEDYKEYVFFRNDKFLFTYADTPYDIVSGYVGFYELDYIKNCSDENFLQFLEAPVEQLENVKFEKNVLIMDKLCEISGFVNKVYRLKVYCPNIKFELKFSPMVNSNTKTCVNNIFAVKSSTVTKKLASLYSDDELMLKYTNYQVEKQLDNPLLVVDYNVDFAKDYTFEVGSRKEVSKPMLIRYNGLDLSLYDEFMFSYIGNDLTIVDMSKVSEDMHPDIVVHNFCNQDNTLFTKGVLVLKEGNDALVQFMEMSSTYYHMNRYFVKDFPENIQKVIKQYLNIPKKEVCNFFAKLLLISPDVVSFIRTHNGIWYL